MFGTLFHVAELTTRAVLWNLM